jgi:hypothetical protein
VPNRVTVVNGLQPKAQPEIVILISLKFIYEVPPGNSNRLHSIIFCFSDNTAISLGTEPGTTRFITFDEFKLQPSERFTKFE